jgi:deoxyribodipyrimidine photo-lyase
VNANPEAQPSKPSKPKRTPANPANPSEPDKPTQKMISLFWFRRDLRLDDNAGLYHALQGPYPVLPVFIFDRLILDDLDDRRDARVEFIHRAVADLRHRLQTLGSPILVRQGEPLKVFEEILTEYKVASVYTNRDYEPYAVERDGAVEKLLASRHIPFRTFKDHVIFEKDEILKKDGRPYTVFTPYSRRWLEKLNSPPDDGHPVLQPFPNAALFSNFLKTGPLPLPSLEEIGFEPAAIPFPPSEVPAGLIRNYENTRDFPAQNGTSRLGVHLRFGTVSIRERVREAGPLSAVFRKELIWRDFYSQILAHFPHVAGEPFRPAYRHFPWRHAPEEFERWRRGLTGYPIVDAGMRELGATGYMHNRVRMIVASFLCKHLLIDWREGEAWFAQKLLDYDLATNNGSWQWAAGTGTDSQPWFRIFNPSSQARKFDPKNEYIRTWVPEYGTAAYPPPMVEHETARQRWMAAHREAMSLKT